MAGALAVNWYLPKQYTATTSVLVDVRSPAEFTGEVLAPPGLQETAQRGGHVPGAKNIPWLGDFGKPKGRGERVVTGSGTTYIATELQDLLLRVPNIPHSSAPDGTDASGNVYFGLHGGLG